jgi:hypothetical protein
VIAEPGHVRDLVVHPRREDQRSRAGLAAATERDDELVALGPRLGGLLVSDDHRLVQRELVAPGRVELVRRGPLLAEQAAHVRGGTVALTAAVEHERAPPCPAEHQSSALPGGAATNDDAIPHNVHDTSLQADRITAKLVCHAGKS